MITPLEQIKERLEKLRELEDYDVMNCPKCGNCIRERTSHHSEDGFSPCCGKKLVRSQGKKDTYSEYNRCLSDIQAILPSIIQEIEANLIYDLLEKAGGQENVIAFLDSLKEESNK